MRTQHLNKLFVQGMQIFRFIFLARSWAYDRLYLSAQLSKLGRKAQQQDNPFALIIYPEGTLVSSDTRPVSKKYAEKMGFVSVPPLSTFFLILLSVLMSVLWFLFSPPRGKKNTRVFYVLFLTALYDRTYGTMGHFLIGSHATYVTATFNRVAV